MTYTSEYGEVPPLADNIFHTEGPLTVGLKRDDVKESGRQKLAEALAQHGLDLTDILGVVVSGVIVYERDKHGHYIVDGKVLVTKEVAL